MVVKTLADAEQVVDATKEFLAFSRASKEALKSANILKSIDANALIEGEIGVGKTTLAKHIITSTIIDGSEPIETILKLISQTNRLIIKNFDKIKQYDRLDDALKRYKTRIIATSTTTLYEKISDRFFSLKIYLPPLREREEDIYPLAKKFFKEACENFFVECDMQMDVSSFSLEKNCYSLKMSVYKAVIEKFYDENDMLRLTEEMLSERVLSPNSYRENLYLYDVPIIRAGLKRFKSQLQVANELGINRNTLRKKINDLKKYFKG